MNSRRLFIVLLVLVAAAIPIGGVLAKGIISVTISGPGLKTEIEVTDPDTNEALMGLIGGREFTRPEVGDTFYRVAIGFGDPATGEVFATNVYHYYPDPQGGQGHVLFTRVEGGSSSDEGQWFRATSMGEQALHKVLAGHGISLAGSKSELPAAAAEQPAKAMDTSSSTSKSAVAAEQTTRKLDTGISGSAPAVAKNSDPASNVGPDNRMMIAAVGGIAILLVGGTLLLRRRPQAQA